MRVWDQEPTACYIQARGRADDFIFLPLVHRNSASKHTADFISAFKKRHLLPFFPANNTTIVMPAGPFPMVNQTKNLNLLELNSLLDEVLPLVQTNLTEKEITSLVLLAPNYQGITLEQMTIPADGTYGSMKGMGGRSMFSTDFNQNAQILKQFIYEIKSSEVQ